MTHIEYARRAVNAQKEQFRASNSKPPIAPNCPAPPRPRAGSFRTVESVRRATNSSTSRLRQQREAKNSMTVESLKRMMGATRICIEESRADNSRTNIEALKSAMNASMLCPGQLWANNSMSAEDLKRSMDAARLCPEQLRASNSKTRVESSCTSKLRSEQLRENESKTRLDFVKRGINAQKLRKRIPSIKNDVTMLHFLAQEADDKLMELYLNSPKFPKRYALVHRIVNAQVGNNTSYEFLRA